MDTPTILPDPFFPYQIMSELSKQGAITMVSGAIVVTGNDAVYCPVVFPCDCTLYAMRIGGTNTTGNYDLAFYDAALNRLASKGSTAMAVAVLSLTLPEIRVIGGELYYAACAFSSSSANILRGALAVTGMQRGLGYGMQASAFPLPNPGVPGTAVSMGAVPLFAFGVR
jgi:hypothetical protein